MSDEIASPHTTDHFDDQVALITGSSRGIGAATAKLLAARGARVVVNYRASEHEAQEVVDAIHADGGKAISVQADVLQKDAVETLVSTTEDQLGTIDVLVSNANLPVVGESLQEIGWEALSRKVNDELRAAYNVTQSVVPGMIEQGSGRIVYVSSGLARYPRPGFSAQGISKAALNTFSNYVAAEYGSEGIIANVVSPGVIETKGSEGYIEDVVDELVQQTPLRALAQAEDIARAIAMFASRDVRFVTGTYTPVDGGLTVE